MQGECMITIVVTHEDDQSDEFDFSPSQPAITIGRRSTNDVCIPNLSVSGRHARIAFSKGEAWIEDLNSTNGTYINNRLISRQILNNDDELVIGKTRVRFFDSNNQQTAIQAEPADVIDIRETEPVHDMAEPVQADEPAPMGVIEVHDAAEVSANVDMSDTGGSPTPNAPYNDDGLDEILGDDKPSKPSFGVGAVAAGSAGAAALAASAKQAVSANRSASDAASSSESMFDAVADGLSDRENNDYPNAEAVDGQAIAADAMDDSGQMSLSDRAKVALGRPNATANQAASQATNQATNQSAKPKSRVNIDNDSDDLAARRKAKSNGATIEIKNGAKSGQLIPIDKPVTTLGRPGIQIAAIMRKPDGYFLMHIESNDSVDRPTLNNDFIGDEPMLLHPGDELNVAGINVEFDLVSQSVPTTV